MNSCAGRTIRKFLSGQNEKSLTLQVLLNFKPPLAKIGKTNTVTKQNHTPQRPQIK